MHDMGVASHAGMVVICDMMRHDMFSCAMRVLSVYWRRRKPPMWISHARNDVGREVGIHVDDVRDDIGVFSHAMGACRCACR